MKNEADVQLITTVEFYMFFCQELYKDCPRNKCLCNEKFVTGLCFKDGNYCVKSGRNTTKIQLEPKKKKIMNILFFLYTKCVSNIHVLH